jgi:hypothetical protein
MKLVVKLFSDRMLTSHYRVLFLIISRFSGNLEEATAQHPFCWNS